MGPVLVVSLLLSQLEGDPCAVPGSVTLLERTVALRPVGAATRVSSSSAAVSVELVGTNVRLTGVEHGFAWVTVEVGDGGVRTIPVKVRREKGCDPSPAGERFKALQPCNATMRVRQVGDRVFVDGVASTFLEWQRAFAAVERDPELEVLGTLDPQVIDRLFSAANVALGKAGLARVRWVRAGQEALLEGELSPDDAPRLKAQEAEWRPRLELVLSHPSRARK